jgi:hypothetical protein
VPSLAEKALTAKRCNAVWLQMARLRNNSLDYNSAKAMTAISKDADMSPFNACSKLFEPFMMGNTASPPRWAK